MVFSLRLLCSDTVVRFVFRSLRPARAVNQDLAPSFREPKPYQAEWVFGASPALQITTPIPLAQQARCPSSYHTREGPRTLHCSFSFPSLPWLLPQCRVSIPGLLRRLCRPDFVHRKITYVIQGPGGIINGTEIGMRGNKAIGR